MTDNEYCYDTTTITAYTVNSKESLNLKDELQTIIGSLSETQRKEKISKLLSSKLYVNGSKDNCEELVRIMQSLSFKDWAKQYAPKDFTIYPNLLKTIKPKVTYFTNCKYVTFHILWVSKVVPSNFGWSKPKKLENYLYEITYDSLDYDFAEYYTRKYKLSLNASCSGIHKGTIRGRNLDWYCNNSCTFVVRNNCAKHKSIGVSGSAFDAFSPEVVDAFSPELVNSGAYSDYYKLLPFVITDGINDAGLCISLNVVPVGDYGKTTGTKEGKKDLLTSLIARYVLDNADSVDQAIQLLNERNILSTYSKELQEEYHYMISDSTKTVIVEFCNNEMVVIDGTVVDDTDGQIINPNMMTNYYLKLGLKHDSYAMGVERMQIIKDNYDSITDEESMLEVMKLLRYTNAYKEETNPKWLTEFCGYTKTFGNLTYGMSVDEPEKFEPILNYCIELYKQGNRNSTYWHTTHTAIYNTDNNGNKTLKILVQEKDTEHNFVL